MHAMRRGPSRLLPNKATPLREQTPPSAELFAKVKAGNAKGASAVVQLEAEDICVGCLAKPVRDAHVVAELRGKLFLNVVIDRGASPFCEELG
jgi:hypothetical protein